MKKVKFKLLFLLQFVLISGIFSQDKVGVIDFERIRGEVYQRHQLEQFYQSLVDTLDRFAKQKVVAFQNKYLSDYRIIEEMSNKQQLALQDTIRSFEERFKSYEAFFNEGLPASIGQLDMALMRAVNGYLNDYAPEHDYRLVLFKSNLIYFEKDLEITEDILPEIMTEKEINQVVLAWKQGLLAEGDRQMERVK